MKVFISYSHEDKRVAESIEGICQQFGIPFFRDEKSISWGDAIDNSVTHELRDCSHLLVVISPASLESPWVAYEVGRASERGLKILPFLTHPSLRAPGFLRDTLTIAGIDILRDQVSHLSLNLSELAENLSQKVRRIPEAIEQLRIIDPAKRALAPSVSVILREFHDRLDDLEKGRLVIRGPEMDNIFGRFVDVVSSGFKALSRDDLDYWSSAESEKYLSYNKTLLERGSIGERIFLLPRSRQITRGHQDALCRQVRMGVSVRIGYLDSCRGIVDDDTELDFGLFDRFAVSFWRFSAGRVFKLSTSEADYHHYSGIYDRVLNVCVDVPAKSGPPRTVFAEEEHLNEWIEKHRRRTQRPPAVSHRGATRAYTGGPSDSTNRVRAWL